MWGEIDTSNDARCREIRRCAKCSAPSVTVVHVTQHYSRGLPTGRTYMHRCGGCSASFDSISVWRAMTQLFLAAMLTVVGFGMTMVLVGALFDYGLDVFAHMDGGGWGYTIGGLLFFVGGLAWAAWTTWLVARLMFLHPVAGSR